MFWHPKDELEDLGPPRKRDLFWAAVAMAILPFVIISRVLIIVRAFREGSVVVSETFGISGTASSQPIKFAAGIAFHVVVLAILTALLWAAALWAQHWLYYRRK